MIYPEPVWNSYIEIFSTGGTILDSLYLSNYYLEPKR